MGSESSDGPHSIPFHKLPHEPSIKLIPFEPKAAQKDIDDLKSLLKASRPIRATYENSTITEEDDLGVGKRWIEEAVEEWKKLDWREWESHFTKYPSYHAHIELDGFKHQVHFTGLFNEKQDAKAVVMTHGWPGSFIEFIPTLDYLSTKYQPSTLPVNIIIPSLIGYGYSSAPPVDRNFTTEDTARVFDKLMLGLGFDEYVAQGGDIGSHVGRFLGNFEACKAVHLNMIDIGPPDNDNDDTSYDDVDKRSIERFHERMAWDFAYNKEHATKTSTIGIVVGSNPIALLAWIGEKMRDWSDPSTTPSLSYILANVTLYWLTDSFATSIFHYRLFGGRKAFEQGRPFAPKKTLKPLGYSHFTHELIPVPIQWAKKCDQVDLVWSRRHERGGHFAALEVPDVLWKDVEDFLQTIW